MNEEDKMMDKINKNLNILDNLLMENGFYKYINKLINIETNISEMYDLLKHYKSIIEQIEKETTLGMKENTNNNDYAKGLFCAYQYINDKLQELKGSDKE